MKDPTPTWRKLFAAALLAAVLVSPSFADDDSSTADRAAKAVGSGTLDALFTGARNHAGGVRAPAPGFFANANPNGTGATVSGAPSQADIDRYIAMDGGTDAEKEFLHKMTAKLATSKTGQEILSKIVADCKAHGDAIHVVAEDFKGSSIRNNGGVEQIAGLSGQSGWEDGKRVFRFNRKFLDFKDQDAALQVAAAIAGHELTHFNFATFFREQVPNYADLVEFLLINEQSARIKGFLVNVELNTGKPNGEIELAKEMGEHPQAFLDEMKTWDPVYAAALQQKELLDPIPAYDARLGPLKKLKDDFEYDGSTVFPLALKQIDHLTASHAALVAEKKIAVPLSLLRENVVRGQGTIVFNAKHTQDAIDRVEGLKQRLNGPGGDLLRQRLSALALNPSYAVLIAENKADQKALKEDVEKLKLTVIPDEQKPLTLAKLKEIFKTLHGDNPPPWNDPKTP